MSGRAPEPEESLSATAMFLRAIQATPAPPLDESQPPPSFAPIPPQPIPPSHPAAAEPGEFTRMFRAVPAPTQAPEPPRAALAQHSPYAPPPAIQPNPSSAGEFTRAFVIPAPAEAPAPIPIQPKSKGFSIPGLSDSASTESSFTKVFHSAPPPPEEPSVPPPSFSTSSWQTSPPASQPQTAVPAPASFTSIFNALSTGNEPRAAASPDLHHNPGPSYAAPPPVQQPPAQTMPTGGGLTQLINLLSEGPAIATASHSTQMAPAPVSPAAEPTTGEFDRILKPSLTNPPSKAAPPLPPVEPAPTPGPLIPPAALKPIAPPKLPPVPKLPTAALPGLPKSKLQEMLPLLLVANAFLMLALIALVILLLHRK